MPSTGASAISSSTNFQANVRPAVTVLQRLDRRVRIDRIFREPLHHSLLDGRNERDDQRERDRRQDDDLLPLEYAEEQCNRCPCHESHAAARQRQTEKHDRAQEYRAEEQRPGFRQDARAEQRPGATGENHGHVDAVVADFAEQYLDRPVFEIAAARQRRDRHPPDHLDRQEDVDGQDAVRAEAKPLLGATAVEQQQTRHDPFQTVDQVFADKTHRGRRIGAYQNRQLHQRVHVEQHPDERNGDDGEVYDQEVPEPARHVPAQALPPPRSEPCEEYDEQQDVPGIQALDVHDRLGKVGMLDDGHQQDEAAKGLVPVAPRVGGEEGDEHPEKGRAYHDGQAAGVRRALNAASTGISAFPRSLGTGTPCSSPDIASTAFRVLV
jgi:hypothetical protein